MKYVQLYSGHWVRPRHRGYRMMCCDCGLVHVVDFRIRFDKRGRPVVEFRADRDKRATAAARRRKQAKR